MHELLFVWLPLLQKQMHCSVAEVSKMFMCCAVKCYAWTAFNQMQNRSATGSLIGCSWHGALARKAFHSARKRMLHAALTTALQLSRHKLIQAAATHHH